MKRGDIDIDFADRTLALASLEHIPASMIRNSSITKHASGVYFHAVPVDPLSGLCSLDYQKAETHSCYKIDMLNVGIYQQVKDEAHLIDLMNREPKWEHLKIREYCEKLTHIGNHYDRLMSLPESIDSILKMAMFLALIRPAKRYLIGKPWTEVEKHIWESTDSGFAFKKSHSLAYAMLVVVHMNLLSDS